MSFSQLFDISVTFHLIILRTFSLNFIFSFNFQFDHFFIMTESPDQLHQSLYQSGLLLISDFRQTLVMELHVENSEKSQLLNALNLLEPTSLDENSLLLLYHDLSYIFTKYFFDFDFGILTPESEFTRTSDTTFFFKDYFLYFSFVSSFYEEPKEFKPELFKEKLSPFLFVSFVHNLIDVSNLAAPSHASNTIEYEMCKQLILNAKQLSQIDTFLILKKDLSTRVSQSLNSSDFKQDEFNAIFQSAFVITIVYPDSDFKDKNFTNLKKKIRKTLKIKKHDFLKKLDQFSEDRNILSYNTFVHKRYSLFNNSWIYPPEILEDFKPIAELRLNILSKKNR
ncbi:hypothetical protein TRFO_23907 [Tritrichomonas foetus]|uniref:Uncharacterized protein n=1 Tax=Tritrichomonas foetus TaxID=1144522 RepID=A0A1J4K8G8_9EUKA|nr:hypothetical protein TRFO_23907 [Tritrichomonas foetus]|eukprot:OHT07793.1 hypothetical protein TRFO_23907 [Tritrichomonas foetus]